MFGKMYIISHVVCLNFLVFRSCLTEICYSGQGQSFSRNYFCCDGFERKNGKCIECKTGYTTTNGESCRPCTNGFFGYRCAESCSICKIFQSCDHVQGCISFSTSLIHTTIEESSDIASVTQYSIQTDTFVHSSSYTTRNLVFIYGLFVCGIIFLVFMFSMWLFYYNRKRNMDLSDRNGEPNTQDNLNESGYEEIDEIALQELTQGQQIVNQSIEVTEADSSLRSSTNASESIQSNLEDYLNPYQPMVQNTEHQIYRRLAGSELLVHNSVMQTSDRDNADNKFLPNEQLEYTNTNKSAAIDPRFQVLHYSEVLIDKISVNAKENVEKLNNNQVFPNPPPFKQKTQYAEIIHQ